MSFNIHQLDHLTYDEAEPLLDDYIEGVLSAFVNSTEGQAYVQEHEEGGGWIGEFIHLGYVYEGFTLPKMTKGNVQLLMEQIFPRKVTIFDPSDADDAIPELVAFWQFLQRKYKFRSAKAIIKYLQTLHREFPRLMSDPSAGGFAKSFLLMGHQSGFDMTTPEGLKAFQEKYNASLQTEAAERKSPIKEKKEQPAAAGEKVPKQMQPKFSEITRLTDAFCKKYLNAEYAQMSRRLAAALCRKRPSPLARGKAKSWACGIVHALGMVNFLYDPSQTPHMKASELYQHFGVAESTGQGKSKQIRDLMDMYQMDPNWCLPSLMDKNPIPWMITVDGLLMDARQAPREIQEEALRKGLIPYLPENNE